MTIQSTSRSLAALILGALLATSPGVALAAQYACGQPQTDGDGPLTSDALAILRAAVGQIVPNCEGIYACVCDVNDDDSILTTDALLVIRAAVGQPVTLDCGNPCPAQVDGLPCTSAEIFTREGSDLDSGWTGIAHNSDIVVGASITVRVKRECSGNGAECEHDDDCTGNGTCEPTCNCLDDVTCEATGPTHQRQCQDDLDDCSTNADCNQGVPCVHVFGPPLPLSAGGSPVCVVSVFDGNLTGTANSQTGEAEISTNLKSRVFLGIANDKPCPRCGAPDQNPEIGDQFTCSGGLTNNLACVVEGVSEEFGGTSSDCAPSTDNISGTGLTIRFNQVTTGTSTKTAQLPCKFFGFTGNPTVPGSNPKCLDKNSAGDPVCTSNADCKRCTLDVATVCASNTDCTTGKGTCAEAPDQPVTCGFWCNCGFCNGNASQPCFQTSDCQVGQVCQIGPGGGGAPNAPQQRPNDCSGDKFVCGGTTDEQCATTEKSSCSDSPFLTCTTDQNCEDLNAGFCNYEPRPCFESRITRTGSPSPLGKYCAFENKDCDTNADCTQTDDFCANDASRAQTVALFCVPATSNSTVNSAGGITGPGAVRLNSFMQVCRCGDSVIGCDEECDVGDTVNGDGCDDLCQIE